MITAQYCQVMARYNAWQNKALRDIVPVMDKADLTAERGAFFGSIFGTLNHLLWADTLWMHRFDGGAGTNLTIAESVAMTPTPASWAADRFRMDGRISQWAQNVSALDLVGDLTWFSGAMGREMSKPTAMCAMHLFNHQTHHRGQAHAMLTAIGQTLPDTDIPFMPEDL